MAGNKQCGSRKDERAGLWVEEKVRNRGQQFRLRPPSRAKRVNVPSADT